jgi:hypothetical protein
MDVTGSSATLFLLMELAMMAGEDAGKVLGLGIPVIANGADARYDN